MELKKMKSFLKVIAGIALFIAIAVGILMFIRKFDRQPSVILTSTECDPPCWYGIHPGQSSASQVYGILDNLNQVSKDSIMGEYDRNYNLTKIYWFFQRPVEDASGSVSIQDERVTAITISTINSLKLVNLFDKLGQPDEYWTDIGYGENREYLEVILLYPAKGYLASLIIDIESDADQVEIQPETPVFRVTYFAPEMYQELLGTRILIDKPASTRTEAFQPWTGFGTIFFQKK
jgi:hypothetical protein